MSTRDSEHVICPFCGYEHGDAWEWCASEDVQAKMCDGCGKEFKCFAEHSVDYVALVPLTEREKDILRQRYSATVTEAEKGE